MLSTFCRRAGVLLLGAVFLLAMSLPASAAGEPNSQPPGLDHFYCYPVNPTTQAAFNAPATVLLRDQSGPAPVGVGWVPRLCTPAAKTRLDDGTTSTPQNPDAHLACFGISQPDFQPKKVLATNQFGQARLDVLAVQSLCLPS